MKTVCVTALFALASCRNVELHIDDSDANARPFADAGLGSTYSINSPVTLDASGSFDLDGTISSYRWASVAHPLLSHSTIADASSAMASVVLDAPGTYTFEVTVTDNDGAIATSSVTYHAVASGLVVNAGPDAARPMESLVQLAGTASVDTGVSLSVTWSMQAKPAGSTAMLSSTTSLAPTFTADREGTYLLRLTATTPFETLSDDVSISATVDRQLLEYVLVDAEYSKPLNRFVIVSDAPARLRLHDPVTGNQVVVNLPASPTSLSVSPDGLRAAVAHTNSVTVINLQTAAVEGTYAVPIAISDLVFGADNRVHCLDNGPNFNAVYTINLATGAVAASTGPQIYHGQRARLHPAGLAMYLATRLESPEDLERFDVSARRPPTRESAHITVTTRWAATSGSRRTEARSSRPPATCSSRRRTRRST